MTILPEKLSFHQCLLLSNLCSPNYVNCYNSPLFWRHFPALWDLNLSGCLCHTKMLCSVASCFQNSQPARDRPAVSLTLFSVTTIVKINQINLIFNKAMCCWSFNSVLLYQGVKNGKCHIYSLFYGVSLFCMKKHSNDTNSLYYL